MSGIDSMTEFYVYENMQLLEQLEEILLSGQSDTGELSQEEIEEIFRAMHTIKGSSAMMGYDSLMNLTHSIEDVFDEKWNQSTIINLVNKHGFSFEEAKELFLHMWLYSNGLATLIATNQIKLDEEKIMIRLVKIYKNLVK